MGIPSSREQRRQLVRDNAKLSLALAEVPRSAWPDSMHLAENLRRVWRSRNFLVQEFIEPGLVCRLSISRSELAGDRWKDGISWDELQSIKNELGWFAHFAIEIYPPLRDEVNVANIRHLWVLNEAPAFAWRNKRHAGA